jgi:hypothetical protein
MVSPFLTFLSRSGITVVADWHSEFRFNGMEFPDRDILIPSDKLSYDRRAGLMALAWGRLA